MDRTGPVFVALIAFGIAGCSGRVIERAPNDTKRVDSGIPGKAPGVTPPATSEAGPPPNTDPKGPPVITGETDPGGPPVTIVVEAGPPPNPACPEVYGGGVPDRSGSGAEGIAALHARVLTSREAFQKYTALHHDTYRYTRSRESFTGSDGCSTTVQVTTGAVSSVTVSLLDPDTSRWSTHTYSPNDPKAASCFEPVTMYDLYDECLTQVLCRDPRKNFLDVHVDARGLLVQCGYTPDGCVDDCYSGLGAIVLTADGKDWKTPLPGCCPISAEPGCCMEYGSWVPNCRTRCDVKPSPSAPGWHIAISEEGCALWVEPPEGTYTDCCGCELPDASVIDPGTRDSGSD